MAVVVARCYRFILTNTSRLEQCKHPQFNSTVLQTFSRAPSRQQFSSSLLVTSALNYQVTNFVRYSFRNWFQIVRPRFKLCQVRQYSNGANGSGGTGGSAATPMKALSSTERIKVILREYGTVAVVFHTAISLFSLGSCYLVVSSGVDVERVLKYFNIESSGTKKGASTFALAYVFHKFLLPLRATITVVSVPVIVRQLRARGWMKGMAKAANSVKK